MTDVNLAYVDTFLGELERVTRESIFKPGDRWKHAHPRTLYALRRTVISWIGQRSTIPFLD